MGLHRSARRVRLERSPCGGEQRAQGHRTDAACRITKENATMQSVLKIIG
jgi:hypothetical protein